MAMRYAADFPDDLAALVIEDMDIRPRRAPSPHAPAQQERLRAYSRHCGDTYEECQRALESFGYDPERVDGWRETGRVFPIFPGTGDDAEPATVAAEAPAGGRDDAAGGRNDAAGGSDGSRGAAAASTTTPVPGWWSNVNPLAQYLALVHVMAGTEGRENFRRLAARTAAPATRAASARATADALDSGGATPPPLPLPGQEAGAAAAAIPAAGEGGAGARYSFPTHLFVAGRHSAVTATGEDGVEGMQAVMPHLNVWRFPDAAHSIHNTDLPGFLEALQTVVDEVQPCRATRLLEPRL